MNVAHQYGLAFGRSLRLARGDPVDADVDHRGARLDPVAAHHLRPADSGHDDVAEPGDRRQVLGARMGDGDGAIGAQQQLGDRLAHQVGSADHDRVAPTQRSQRVL